MAGGVGRFVKCFRQSYRSPYRFIEQVARSPLKNEQRLLWINGQRLLSSQVCNIGPVKYDPTPKVRRRRRVDSDSRPVPKTANPNMKANALKIFEAGVEAVLPRKMVTAAIEVDGDEMIVGDMVYQLHNNVYVIAFGKAVGGMVRTVQELLGDHIVKGIASVPYGLTEFATTTSRDYLIPHRDGKITVYEGAKNNLPDECAQRASSEILALAHQLGKCDICLTLISGGGSALLASPIPPITVAELREVVSTMSRAGATIQEINAVRKNVEILKGGGLATAAAPAQVVGLTLSNVIGSNPNDVAAAPLVPSASTLPPNQSLYILERIYKKVYDGKCIPENVRIVLEGCGLQCLYEPDCMLDRCVQNQLLGNNNQLTCRAAQAAEELGAISYIFANEIQGKVKEIGVTFSQIAHFLCHVMANRKGNRNADLTGNEIELIQRGIQKPMIKELGKLAEKSMNTGQAICIVAGSKTTSVVCGPGVGGPNQEMALYCAHGMHRDIFENDFLAANFDVCFLSCDTSGRDGTSCAAGALVDPATVTRATEQDMSVQQYLKDSDSHGFFERLCCGDDQIITNLTGTDVMNFHLLLIKPNLC